MMFDPPDYPYRDLSDPLPEPYDTDDLLMTNHTDNNNCISTAKSLAEVTELMISSVENQLSFASNESSSYFNIETKSFLNTNHTNIESNATLYTIQPADNLFNYEPTLLDENTVNQFLLPLQTSTADKNKDCENNGPDLLSLHSCVICHDIFTTDLELLDHTILVHASVDDFQQNNENIPEPTAEVADTPKTTDAPSNDFEIDAEWLVCSTCSRILSTALEIENSEQLCCIDGEGKGSFTTRKLHTMYVCDYCSGLFADVDALNGHATTCFAQDSQILYPNLESRPEVYFPCSSCNKQYPTAEELKTHLSECQRPSRRNERKAYNTAGANKMWNCGSCNQLFATASSCNKQYPTAEELKTHLSECQRPSRRNERKAYNTAGANKMWNCGSCNQLFTIARELYKHKRGEDRPPGAPLVAYVCEECDKVLGSMCALHTHKKMHKVTKPGYPCRVCGRRFNQSGHLAIHMRMHTGERPYPCDLCPKAFKVKVERDDHRRTHTGERPFACLACPKTFTAAARLREHARIHTDQRPYRCEICGAAFRRPYARTVHTLIHTGEKPHECDVCGTAFRRSGDMWKHKRTQHGIQAGQDP